MFHTGLVSISFRALSPERIVELTAQGGLEGVEWGGDVHVPHGNVARAEEVRQLTERAGLRVAAYGSYYRCAGDGGPGPAFGEVLASARALHAPTIRVWAGSRGSAAGPPEERRAVEDDLRRIGDVAGEAGIRVSCEYHGGTLTDTNDSARLLYEELEHPNVRSYWQPPNDMPADYCRRGLRNVLPVLENLHVFHWTHAHGKRDRRPLAEGADLWRSYLEIASEAPGDRWALLEFVRNDSEEAFLADALTLRELCTRS